MVSSHLKDGFLCRRESWLWRKTTAELRWGSRIEDCPFLEQVKCYLPWLVCPTAVMVARFSFTRKHDRHLKEVNTVPTVMGSTYRSLWVVHQGSCFTEVQRGWYTWLVFPSRLQGKSCRAQWEVVCDSFLSQFYRKSSSPDFPERLPPSLNGMPSKPWANIAVTLRVTDHLQQTPWTSVSSPALPTLGITILNEMSTGWSLFPPGIPAASTLQQIPVFHIISSDYTVAIPSPSMARPGPRQAITMEVMASSVICGVAYQGSGQCKSKQAYIFGMPQSLRILRFNIHQSFLDTYMGDDFSKGSTNVFLL